MQHGAAPDHGLVARIQEAHGNHLDALRHHRNDAFVLRGLWFRVGAEHDGHIGAVNIGVHQSDFVSKFRKGQSKIYGDSGFPHATFSAGNCYEILHAGNWLTYGLLHGTGSWRHFS